MADSSETDATFRGSTTPDDLTVASDAANLPSKKNKPKELPRILHQILECQLPCELPLRIMFAFNAGMIVLFHIFVS